MSRLFFRYSEAYDAGISYWVNALDAEFFAEKYDNWHEEYVIPGRQFATQLQNIWNPINDQVFSAFNQIGYTFPELWQAYVIHPWPKVLPYKDPLTIFIQEDQENALNEAIHEITHCHEDYEPNRAKYQAALEHIKTRFPEESPIVQYHLVTNLVQWSVQRIVFPNQWREYVDRTKGNEHFQRVAEIIDIHADNINYDYPLESLLQL
jgi:hypothetical protein